MEAPEQFEASTTVAACGTRPGLAESEEVRMRNRVLILGLLLATLPAMGCWRARNSYRPPSPCCPQPAAVLLPATSVPVVATSAPCCPSPCP